MDRLKRVASWLWYPWLAALFPIIFLYSNNFGKVFADEFLAACGVALIAVGLLVGLFWLMVRDAHRAGAMTLALMIPFFAYSPLIDVITSGRPGALNRMLPVRPLVIGVAIAVVLVAVVTVLFSARMARTLTFNLNILAAALVAFNLGILAVKEIQYGMAVQSRNVAQAAVVRAPKVNDDSQYPDVYYIILDAYPSNAALLKESRIDNSDFTDALEKRGFYVAYGSTSNYPLTLPSLSSSLNMRYLQSGEGPDSYAAYAYATELIADSTVAKKFLSLGYTYHFIMSGLDSISAIADMNINYYPDGIHYLPHGMPPSSDSFLTAFWPLVFDSTMLSDVNVDPTVLSRPSKRPTGHLDPMRALATFDEATKIAQMPQATFTFVHFLVPHIPIRFTRDGQIITGRDEIKRANGPDRKQAFGDQLQFVNAKTLRMIDDILSQSDTSPIIILQADHGSQLGNPVPHNNARFFKILNAYHFPGPNGQAHLTQDITPVNSFRVLFNTYFGADYGLLANRYFRVPRLYEEIFELEEITAPQN